MKDGFLKVAAVTPKVKVADPTSNAAAVMEGFDRAVEQGAKIIVFPELVLTAYTCSDLFLQETLLAAAKDALRQVIAHTAGTDALALVGLPLRENGCLYNAAAVIQNGKLLAFIPKRFIPNYSEFYEARHFTSGPENPVTISFDGAEVPFGSKILFPIDAVPGAVLAAEICEDVWVANAPDIDHALAGATIIANLSASDEVIGKGQYRELLLSGVSARTVSAYIYADAGEGESSTDLVFGGQNLIIENGTILAEAKLFEPSVTVAAVDILRLLHDRQRMNTFESGLRADDGYLRIPVHMETAETALAGVRSFDPHPFVPSDPAKRRERCEEIFAIQARGLAKRIAHVGSKTCVIGVSGGLDSTLALLVTARAFDLLGRDHKDIIAVTMPAFGTTHRTHSNALEMSEALHATLREINIEKAVLQHFADIGHDPKDHSVTYENCQARERTQVLMDIANETNGLVIGTGDMSEMALGWATYNGDHMSMYAVNIGVPKTLVRHLVQYCADIAETDALRRCLLDVLDTPVSPELLPPTGDGKISQKTEDLVGPYELHDFFLYYMLRWGFPPRKILRISKLAFADVYDDETILKWLRKFYWRFFSQQFKRSCIPDGPKVGSVALSPRGDLRMPSDAVVKAWIDELE